MTFRKYGTTEFQETVHTMSQASLSLNIPLVCGTHRTVDISVSVVVASTSRRMLT